jgi:hypothetical protein
MVSGSGRAPSSFAPAAGVAAEDAGLRHEILQRQAPPALGQIDLDLQTPDPFVVEHDVVVVDVDCVGRRVPGVVAEPEAGEAAHEIG